MINHANVAPTSQQGHTYVDYGLDLGSPTGPKLDGTVDNSFGQAIGALVGLGFDVQGTVDTAINTGAIILLVDFQTSGFTNAAAASFRVKFGTTPSPPACASAQDTTCGGHLKGTALIGIAANSPSDAALTGQVVNGTFNGGPGTVGIQLVFGNATPITIDLIHARAQATGITTEGMTAKIGGLITQTELQNNIAPALLSTIDNLLATAGCNPDGNPNATPICGCTNPTTTVDLILSSIDGDTSTPKDCKITVDELLGFQAIQAVLRLDSCSQDSCTSPDSYSFGMQVTTVPATFPTN